VNGLFLKPFRLPFPIQETADSGTRMSDDAFWQAAAARTVERFLGDLCWWAIRPDPGGLPSGWAGAYRDRLNELGGLVASRFGRDQAGDREFRAAAAAARELIGILEGNPRLAVVPVSEWTIAAFVEVFERVAKHCSRFAELASWEPLQLPAASIEGGRVNPWRQAAAVLRSFAWLEGTPEPFGLGSAVDPQAVESWNRCVDAVAALPDEGGPLGIARRLKLRFNGAHSSPAGNSGGEALWRWENCPSGPWVSAADLEALRQAAAAWDLLNSREHSDDSPEAREARRIQRLAEWRQTVAAIDPLRPEALRQLRVAGAVLWGAEQPGGDPSAAKLNAVAELSRTLKPKIRQAADALGFSAADQAALFAVDYSTHANAWEALQAAAANRAAAVAVESAAVESQTVAAPAVEWSNPRTPAQWRQLRSEKEMPDSETWWKKQRKNDRPAFHGNTKLVRITRAKALEWGLELEEFKSPH
jgi:hypothetical protein